MELPKTEGGEDMESRMTSLEQRVNAFSKENLPERVHELERGHKDLKESDRQQMLIIEGIAEQIKAHSQKQTETNLKVDGVTRSVELLNQKMTENSVSTEYALKKIDGSTEWVQSTFKEFLLKVNESAAGDRREKEVTKREWWTNFFKFLGAVIGGGAGVALIDFLIKQ